MYDPSYEIPIDRQHGRQRKPLKNCLKFYTVLTTLCGLVAICTGIWVFFGPAQFEMFHGMYRFLYPASLYLACGTLSIILSGFGWIGVVRESRSVLRLFNVLLLVASCAQIVSGGVAIAFHLTIREEVKTQAEVIVKQEYGSGNIALDGIVDRLQQELRCCGASTWRDYNESYWRTTCENPKKLVPESCCADPVGCTTTTDGSLVHRPGCGVVLGYVAKYNFLLLGSIGVVLGGVQLVGFLFAICFYVRLNRVIEVVPPLPPPPPAPPAPFGYEHHHLPSRPSSMKHVQYPSSIGKERPSFNERRI